MLDDIPNADRKSDRLLATLPPREPTIQRDGDSPCMSKLRTSRSEYNMSRTKSSSLTPSAGLQAVRARLATSISVGNSLSTRTVHTAVAGYPAQSDVVGSWKVHDINEVREPPNVNSSHDQRRVRTNEQPSTLGRVNSAIASASQVHQQVGQRRTDHDQHKRVSAKTDGTQSISQGTRPRSVPPKLSHQLIQVHDAQCDDTMGAQYEPGNVRHLVQTFQSAFRPVTTLGHGDADVGQTADHSGSRQADEPPQMSAARDSLQAADRHCHPQTSGNRAQEKQWPPSHRAHTLPPRTDANVNVCVVRPATGRTLPHPPTPDQSQSLATCRPSTPAAQELPNQLEKSSNKVGKLWQTYGCL